MTAITVSGIDELRELIGKPIGPTEWLEVSQADIDKFAEVSRDDQWIHVDRERAARESPFGTTVAHGNLTLSLIDGFRTQLIKQEGVAMGINYGWNKVRFPAPVPAGARVRATAEVVPRGDQVHPRARGRGEAGLRRRVGRTRPGCLTLARALAPT
jgi:acyl dehydratase